ncbi:MAG TPA: hypothetical protein VFA26_25600 [Gemmataceae bacterium]|nr:hypothetical protein [Gemmataceae bacterium]
MYFRGGGLWQQLCTQRHNGESTVRHRDDALGLKFRPGFRDGLFKGLSPLRYDEPLFYGLFRKHVFIVMFEKPAGIRFTRSPSGGGVNKERQTANPAWDWQFLIPKYEVKSEYGFRARVVYRERCGRDKVLRELRDWHRGRFGGER